MVLAARPSDESAEAAGVALSGRTSHRERIELYVAEGRVWRFSTRAWVWCGDSGRFYYWVWSPNLSMPDAEFLATPGAEFSQNGTRFVVRDRDSTIPMFSSSVRLELRGRLDEDGRSARGTLDAWVRQRGQRPPCFAQARFRVSR
jgi:hypothetical protein